LANSAPSARTVVQIIAPVTVASLEVASASRRDLAAHLTATAVQIAANRAAARKTVEADVRPWEVPAHLVQIAAPRIVLQVDVHLPVASASLKALAVRSIATAARVTANLDAALAMAEAARPREAAVHLAAIAALEIVLQADASSIATSAAHCKAAAPLVATAARTIALQGDARLPVGSASRKDLAAALTATAVRTAAKPVAARVTAVRISVYQMDGLAQKMTTAVRTTVSSARTFAQASKNYFLRLRISLAIKNDPPAT
jgi:hypothetical protein